MKQMWLIVCVCWIAACGVDSKGDNNSPDAGTDVAQDAPICGPDDEPAECLEGTIQCDDDSDPECTAVTGACGDVIYCRAEFDGNCNNTFTVGCPTGSVEQDCTPGVGTCYLNEEGVGGCATPSTCDCATCEFGSFEVASCDGRENCATIPSCDQQLSCAACVDAQCGEGETPATRCPDGATCRTDLCPTDNTIDIVCVADEQCPAVVECPLNTVPCDTPSDTCLEEKYCGVSLLCEAT